MLQEKLFDYFNDIFLDRTDPKEADSTSDCWNEIFTLHSSEVVHKFQSERCFIVKNP